MKLLSHSKPLKQPKSPQILSENRTKTPGANEVGPKFHFFTTPIELTLVKVSKRYYSNKWHMSLFNVYVYNYFLQKVPRESFIA